MSAPFDVAAAHTVRSLVDRHARERGDRLFLADPKSGRSVTYRELADEVRELGGALPQEAGAPVGVMASNGWHAARALLAVMCHGHTAVPVNLAGGDPQVAHALGHSGCRTVFVDDDSRDRLGRIVSDNRLGVAVADIAGPLPGPAAGGASPARGDRAMVMYTSGTTGVPKGVVHTHASLLAGGANTAAAHRLSGDDRALCVLPLYHINGLCVTLFAPLVSGSATVTPPRFSASRFWGWAAAHGCTWSSVVPTQVSHLLHTPGEAPPGMRFVRSASSALPPELLARFEERFGIPLIETMGLTETAAQILSNPMPPGRRQPGSPGKAVGNEVRILDDGRRPLPAGDTGEIAVRGDNVMLGYLRDPGQTAQSLADGWLLTGDLGRMDRDGYVFVTGRKKELIIKGGENIAPREVDEALHQAPDVVEAAAFGRPCDTYGQRVEACVVLGTPGSHTEEELIGLCRRAVGDFRAPDRIHFMEDLPKGPSGKVQRLRLAEMVGDG